MTKVSIVAAGSLSAVFLTEIKKADYVLAADSASLWLINHGIIPDLALGDFDSISTSDLKLVKKRIPVVKVFSPDKNYSDTHLAVKEVLKINPDQVVIFGATGSRLDHLLANVTLLELFLKKGIPAKIVDPNNEIRLGNGIIELTKKSAYPYLSIIPYSPIATVSTKGCRFEIKNKKISRGESVGISNEILKNKCRITVTRGTIILIRSANT